MTSIAFIGGDGAGKTTVAHTIINTSERPMKYLYMGLSTRSSAHALPTSRLVLFLKRQRYKKAVKAANGNQNEDIPANGLEYAEPKFKGWLWNSVRFINQLAEATYRQVISTGYQLRGYIVVYDRHFYFDAAPINKMSSDRSLQFFNKLFHQLMSRWYPHPTLTILLDAPAGLLFERKGEASPGYLERQREIFLEQGTKLKHFVCIDATQPVEMVIEEAMQVIREHQVFLEHPKLKQLAKEETALTSRSIKCE